MSYPAGVYKYKVSNPNTTLTHFITTGLFLYPLKTSENHRFSDVFRGYRKRPVAWKGLTYFSQETVYIHYTPPHPPTQLTPLYADALSSFHIETNHLICTATDGLIVAISSKFSSWDLTG